MLNKSLIIRLTTNPQQTMDSTDSTLGEIVSSFLHEFLSAYIQEFEQVSDIFHLGIQLKFNRSFSEECYKLLCVIFFGKGKCSQDFQGKLSEAERQPT